MIKKTLLLILSIASALAILLNFIQYTYEKGATQKSMGSFCILFFLSILLFNITGIYFSASSLVCSLGSYIWISMELMCDNVSC